MQQRESLLKQDGERTSHSIKITALVTCFGIEFKILLLVYKSLHNHAPEYIRHAVKVHTQ